MVGNHDWFYHLPSVDRDYERIRDKVRQAIGLSDETNGADKPFPHDPDDSTELMAIMREHGVFARHGDVWDSANYEGDRDTSSVGDAIVIERLAKFAFRVASDLGSELPRATIEGLKELDNVRPFLVIPVWLNGLLKRTCPDPKQSRDVKKLWAEVVADFASLDFVRDRMPAPYRLALRSTRNLSVRCSAWLDQKLSSKFESVGESYAKFALQERDFRNRRAKYIVYGHTHREELVPLDVSFNSNGMMHQVYFNSGTWRRVHSQAVSNRRKQIFSSRNVMSYIAFFKEDERLARQFECWSGSLGLPAET